MQPLVIIAQIRHHSTLYKTKTAMTTSNDTSDTHAQHDDNDATMDMEEESERPLSQATDDTTSSTKSRPQQAQQHQHDPTNLHKLVHSAHQTMARIDQLERKLNERAMRLRRRTLNILDPHLTKPYRSTHLRCFLTHAVTPADEATKASMTSSSGTTIAIDPIVVYTLRIEGKLLIGHLDHAQADAYDARTHYTPTSDDYLDRNQRAADKEEDDVLPIKFTHLFERAEVQLQSTYSPRPHPMAKKKPPAATTSKKRRGSTSKSPLPEETAMDPKDLVLSDKTTLVWTKDLSADAHAFDFQYTPPPAQDSRVQLHSVIAKVKLFPNKAIAAKDPLYEISPQLAAEFFPRHVPLEVEAIATKNNASSSSTGETTEGNADGTGGDTASAPSSNNNKETNKDDTDELPAMEDEIAIPPEGLTMRQIVNAFFTYIHDNQLCDESDKSLIICDAKLQKVLGVERFNFSAIQQLLAGKYLVRPMHTPVKLTHVMKEENSTNYTLPPDRQEEDPPTPSQLQFDMDIHVPAFFPFRARELLRRIKRRELEYTSSRTKARYLLMARRAKDEDAVKAILDQVVSGRQYGADLVPIFAALAKAAPPHSEARMAAQCDQRMSYLLPKVEDATMAAQRGWDKVSAIVEKCRTNKSLTKSDTVKDEEKDDESSNVVEQMEE